MDLYGLKDEAKIWNDLLFKELIKRGLQEMQSAYCILVKYTIIAVCYVDDLVLFVKDKRGIN